jgi:hypothetical protein
MKSAPAHFAFHLQIALTDVPSFGLFHRIKLMIRCRLHADRGNSQGLQALLKLDPIDLRILDAVQRDGRITKLALADEIGLPPAQSWMRLRKLERAGIVTGYHARVSTRHVAPVATILMEVRLARTRSSTSSASSMRSAIFPRSSPAGLSVAKSTMFSRL